MFVVQFGRSGNVDMEALANRWHFDVFFVWNF